MEEARICTYQTKGTQAQQLIRIPVCTLLHALAGVNVVVTGRGFGSKAVVTCRLG